MRPHSRMTITWTLFASMMFVVASQALAQDTGTREGPPKLLPLNALGFQADSSSPLILEGNLIGHHAIWQLRVASQSGTFETIPPGSTFNGAACRLDYRKAEIVAQDSTLIVEVYATRCEPYNSSGVPTAAYTANGVYSILGGTGRFAGIIGGTGSIQFDAKSDGTVFVSIHGSVFGKAVGWG